MLRCWCQLRYSKKMNSSKTESPDYAAAWLIGMTKIHPSSFTCNDPMRAIACVVCGE